VFLAAEILQIAVSNRVQRMVPVLALLLLVAMDTNQQKSPTQASKHKLPRMAHSLL